MIYSSLKHWLNDNYGKLMKQCRHSQSIRLQNKFQLKALKFITNYKRKLDGDERTSSTSDYYIQMLRYLDT